MIHRKIVAGVVSGFIGLSGVGLSAGAAHADTPQQQALQFPVCKVIGELNGDSIHLTFQGNPIRFDGKIPHPKQPQGQADPKFYLPCGQYKGPEVDDLRKQVKSFQFSTKQGKVTVSFYDGGGAVVGEYTSDMELGPEVELKTTNYRWFAPV